MSDNRQNKNTRFPPKPHAGMADEHRPTRSGNPISGSRLYRETDGKLIYLLPTRAQGGAGAANLPTIKQGVTKLPIVGHAFMVTQSQILLGSANCFMKFRENQNDKSDWINLVRVGDATRVDFTPLSPGGPVVAFVATEQPVVIAPTNLIYRLNFDEIWFDFPADTVFNALIAVGNADFQIG